MRERRQHGVPLIVPAPLDYGAATRLERIRFERGNTDGAEYDEKWLQRLVQKHPELLPIDEIEPAYRPIIPVCMELPTSRGFVDNFFITPNGNLIFAECKLWRNTESRREVIAQVLDYVESITAWSYDALQAASARAEPGEGRPTPEQLYDFVADETELDEPEFIDAVSRNLRLGRGLFFVIGDGIREEAETLAEHLQAHAGMHFALALVEIAGYLLPDGAGYLLQPRTIARTVNIERGIVRVEDARIVIEEPEDRTERSAAGARRSLSAEEFFERLGEHAPGTPARLQDFLDRLNPVGVEPEFKRSLILRWYSVDGTPLNIGYIMTNGDVWTDAVNWRGRELGILDLTHEYVRELAAAVGGQVRQMPTSDDYRHVVRDGKAPNISDMLKHDDDWIRVIERLGQRVNERFEAAEN